MSFSLKDISASSSSDIKSVEWNDYSFCSGFVNWKAIVKTFDIKRPFMLQRPRNEHSSVTFVGLCTPGIAFVVRPDISGRPC